MLQEVEVLAIGFPAIEAFEGFLTCVHSPVALKV